MLSRLKAEIEQRRGEPFYEMISGTSVRLGGREGGMNLIECHRENDALDDDDKVTLCEEMKRL